MASHREVAHAWAHNLDKQYKGFNMFRGHSSGYGSHKEEYDTIFSCGHHFPIARHCEDAKGNKFIMFTTRGYSPSTGTHISCVRHAIPPEMTVYCVDNVNAETKAQHKANYQAMKKERLEIVLKIPRARANKHGYILEADDMLVRMNHYSKVFKLGYREVSSEIDEAVLLAVINKAATQRKLAQKMRDKAAQEKLKLWLNFETHYYPPRTTTAHVRANMGNDTIETSYGASVPLSEAIELFKLAKKCKERGKGFKPSNLKGRKVGGFPVTQIKASGDLIVACHTTAYASQVFAAKQAGVL